VVRGSVGSKIRILFCYESAAGWISSLSFTGRLYHLNQSYVLLNVAVGYLDIHFHAVFWAQYKFLFFV